MLLYMGPVFILVNFWWDWNPPTHLAQPMSICWSTQKASFGPYRKRFYSLLRVSLTDDRVLPGVTIAYTVWSKCLRNKYFPSYFSHLGQGDWQSWGSGTTDSSWLWWLKTICFSLVPWVQEHCTVSQGAQVQMLSSQ